MEDDIFFEHEAERAISNNEMDRLRDSFTTLGLKDGILETKFEYDQDIINRGFIDGFNSNLKRGYAGGRIDALQYIVMNILQLDKNTEDTVIKHLTTMKSNLNNSDVDSVHSQLNELSNQITQQQQQNVSQ